MNKRLSNNLTLHKVSYRNLSTVKQYDDMIVEEFKRIFPDVKVPPVPGGAYF